MRYDILLTIFPSYIQSVKCYDKNMYLLINRNNFNLVISLKDISEMFILTFFPQKKSTQNYTSIDLVIVQIYINCIFLFKYPENIYDI